MKPWDKLRPEIDEAIRAGLTACEFRELHNISRSEWYSKKPRGFHWAAVQSKLGIDVKKQKPSEKIEKPEKLKTKRPSLDFYDQRLASLAASLYNSISNKGHTPRAHEIIDELYDLNQFLVNRRSKS